MKRGQSRYPPENLRIFEEDLIKNSTESSTLSTKDDDLEENFEAKKDLRNMQFAETKDFNDENDEELDYEQEQERSSIRGGGDLVFTRQKDQARL